MVRGIQVNANALGLSMEDCQKKYLRNCEIRNLRPATMVYYESTINIFTNLVGKNRPAASIHEDDIEDFILLLKQKNTPISINSKLRQLKCFLHFCMERDYISRFEIPLIKADEVQKEPYSKYELTLLLEKPISVNFNEWRSWGMVNFFLGTGCRLSTTLSIKVKDIDFQQKTIFLSLMKNRKQKYLPLSTKLAQTLQLYLSIWDAGGDDYLFPNSFDRGILHKKSAQDALVTYNHKRGVETTGIHRFRHTFAKEYLMCGGGALQLQQLLCHSTLDMTKKYVNLYTIDLQKDFDSFCPLDNM